MAPLTGSGMGGGEGPCELVDEAFNDVENKTTYIAYMKNILKFLLYPVNEFNIISCDVINY